MVNANQGMRALLLSDDPPVGPSRMVMGEDGRELQAFFRRTLGAPELGASLLFTTGFGIRSEEIPVRLPAVLVPALQSMERLAALGLRTPTYVVYQATAFIAQTNRLPAAMTERTSTRMLAYLRRYVDAMHPDIAGNVEFRFQTDARLDSAVVERVKEDLRRRMRAGSLPESVSQQLAIYGRNNGATEEAQMAYAAANVICNGALPADYPFATERFARATMIVPVGGRKEAPFFLLTRQLAKEAGGAPVAPIVVQPGTVPTYYAHRGGDVLDAASCDLATLRTLHPDLRRDFDVLAADGADTRILRDLFEPRSPDVFHALSAASSLCSP